MAAHSSILSWRIPWTEEPGGLYSPQGRKESDTTEGTARTHGSIWLLTGLLSMYISEVVTLSGDMGLGTR